jgi:hypothetical protein
MTLSRLLAAAATVASPVASARIARGMRARSLLLVAALLPAGCGGTPVVPTNPRPEWRSAAIDGLAPLMSPREVAAALARRGYAQVRCAGRGALLADPLNDPDGQPCFRSPTRPMTVGLFFLDLNEGRRLAVVTFRRDDRADVTGDERVRTGNALARRLRGRFGPPTTTVDQPPDFRSFYWRRPGGRDEQPDTISATVGRDLAPGITMTSMWAYGEVRPERR